MRPFVDSSVLVAAFHRRDPRHEASVRILERFPQGSLYSSGHSLAETYSVITGFPGSLKAAPQDALLFLSSVRQHLSLCALESNEYFAILERCASRGDSGGSIYDVLIGQCAIKAEATTLFSWNARDFTRLFPEKPGWCVTPDAGI